MRKTQTTLAVTLAVGAMLSLACNARSSPGRQESPAAGVPIRLDKVVDFIGPRQITYRSTGSGTRGKVIWRINGALQRWDEAQTEGDSPAQGLLEVHRTANGRTEALGCLWVAAPDGRSAVEADCGSGGAPLVMEMAIQQALLEDVRAEGGPARTILGFTTACYAGQQADEFCADDRGRLLFISVGSGSSRKTFEAVFVVDELEAFDWLAIDFTGMPTTTWGKIVPARQLQFPAEFGFAD